MDTEIAIKTENLTKDFGEKRVVNNLNIEIQKGEIFGFLGPNGSGKSTTIKMLCGLIEPTDGNAYVGKHSILKDDEQIRKEIGYMSQKFSLYDDLTVRQNLEFYSELYKGGTNKAEQQDCINEVMQLVNIKTEERKTVFKLSGGYKQRLAFACAYVHKPKIMFLDEPTAGIDPVARKEMWDLFFSLTRQGTTMFVTTHYMDEAERCNKIGYIFNGKLIAYGLINELSTSKQSLEDLFVKLTNKQQKETTNA